MTSNNKRVENVIREYLERYLERNKLIDAWTLADSPISGRGLRATRDLQPGDVIFYDRPVVLGPRVAGNPVCVGCHLESDDLEQCPKGCKLPVCSSQCSKSRGHKNECTILAAHGSSNPQASWSPNLLHSVIALRCLQLNEFDRKVVQCLQCNKNNTHDQETEVLRRLMGDKLTSEDEEWIKLCCRALDTNAFETLKRITVKNKQREGTLRGLYPLGALLNHECSPNTTHLFDENYNMIVQATRFIAAGSEITTSYCPLLWDTSSRRLNLAKTKQFACTCDRCKDPTEFGTNLSGLPCPQQSCSGVILSSNPLIPHRSSWMCTECSVGIPIDQVMKLQRVQGMLLMGTDTSNPQSVLNALELKRVPQNSVVEIQLKLGLCFQLGHVENFKWEELTEKQLEAKERICSELLDLLEKLRLGECRLRGTILFELHSTLAQQLKRVLEEKNKSDENKRRTKTIREAMEKTLKATSIIMAADATAPKELRDILTKKDLIKKNGKK